MYITNKEELVDALKPRLREYLTMMVGEEAQKKQFCCYVHQENTPSMAYNPKTGFTTVHCFGCGVSHDIFDACEELEGLPARGPDWITQTLPHLAEKLGVEVRLGEASPTDRAKGKLYKLCSDIAKVLSGTTSHLEYLQERGWSDKYLKFGRISIEDLKSQLMDMGWSHSDLDTSLMLESSRQPYFGEEMSITVVIEDYRGRPIGFQSRRIEGEPKYINTPETLIYEKKKTLLGLNSALKEARHQGLYIVEGPGDLASLHRAGVSNAAALCGSSFTADHLQLLKMLGIRRVYFALDWEESGYKAVHRILKEELRFAPGVSCYVVDSPESGEEDPNDYINAVIGSLEEGEEEKAGEAFHALKKIPAFDWVIDRIGKTSTPEDLCDEMVPIIASEETAVRREMFTASLAKRTGISHQAIDQDVRNIRDGKTKERNERHVAAAEQYIRAVRDDPGNTMALLAEYESNMEYIEKEFGKDTIGVNYQLSKYEALQEKRAREAEAGKVGEFTMAHYTQFREAFSGGATWTDGVLVYLGGRENSGKTATCIGLAMDIALNDPDAIVLMHFTDDSFAQVEPRLKANIALMTMGPEDPLLTIGMTNDPTRCETAAQRGRYFTADEKFRELIADEKLIILDMEDGSTLSTLEKNLRHVRRRHPERKLFVVCDNTHNYMDYLQLDQPTRMTRISNTQKMLTGKYHCAIFATAEYRKNTASDTSKMKLPTNDDLADARALKYRPNAIIHVYNDLNDRMDDAEIFWESDRHRGTRLPRLMLVVAKNKISKYKDKLMMDLDPDTVCLREYDTERARQESEDFFEKKENGQVRVEDGVIVEADW